MTFKTQQIFTQIRPPPVFIYLMLVAVYFHASSLPQNTKEDLN